MVRGRMPVPENALRERGIRDRPNVGVSPLSSEPQGGKDNGLRLRVKAFRGIITSLYDSSFRKLRLAYGTFISRLELRPLTSTPPRPSKAILPEIPAPPEMSTTRGTSRKNVPNGRTATVPSGLRALIGPPAANSAAPPAIVLKTATAPVRREAPGSSPNCANSTAILSK